VEPSILVPKHVCCKMLGVHHNTDPEALIGPADARVLQLGDKIWYAWSYNRLQAFPSILDEGNMYELVGPNYVAKALDIPRPKVSRLMGKATAYLMLGQKQSPTWTSFHFECTKAKLFKAREAGDRQYERKYPYTPRMSAKRRMQLERKDQLNQLQEHLNRRYLCAARHTLAANQVSQPMKPGWRRGGANDR
jgi:hypothetical protein